MWFFLRSFLIVFTVLVSGISSVSAEVYYWQEPHTKVSVTVPDTWRMAHDQKPDTVLTFMAPGVNDHASCQLRVREDNRFVIYPQRFSDEIQRTNFSRGFWEDYIGQYDRSILHEVTDNAGFGRGFGSFAEASYITNVGPKVRKRSLIFASLYNDRLYILDCSAEVHAYTKWYHSFMSVAKSVDFRKMIHEFPIGHYRHFLGGQMRINGPHGTVPTYY